jgi:hypothetical protein
MEEELRKKQEQDEEQGEYGSEERGAALPEHVMLYLQIAVFTLHRSQAFRALL